MDKMRIAVIGGGAVAEHVHLPALGRSSTATATVLVEQVAERAARLASLFGIPRVATDYQDALEGVDAAIVGLPHQFHSSVTIDLLEAGIHVLVEKPMALSPGECDQMNAAAERASLVLAVGLLRRCAPSLRWVAHALESGALGRIETFDLREGAVFSWPVASLSTFTRQGGGGGGVLADAGSHVLDLVTWWFGDCRSLRYWDDAEGGVEADCLLELEMQNGACGRIELSRTRNLSNSCVISGELGTITVGTKTDSTVTVMWPDGTAISSRASVNGGPAPTNLVDLFTPQLEQFVRAIRYGEQPVVSGVEARRSIALLTACYQQVQRWIHPWDVVCESVTEPEPQQVAR
jgi:predicted dehydrogenase